MSSISQNEFARFGFSQTDKVAGQTPVVAGDWIQHPQVFRKIMVGGMTLNFNIRLLAVVVLCFMMALITLPASAVETKILRDTSFQDFNQGESTGTEILAQGRMRIGTAARQLAVTTEGLAWRAAVNHADGSILFSTGHNGKIFRHTAEGKTDFLTSVPEVEAVSIIVDPKGMTLAGASPGGRIYRLTASGKPEVCFETKEQYIWDMAYDREGALFAATGPNGKIFRIEAQGKGAIYFETGATNVMALAFMEDGKLVAATQGKGMVFEIAAANKGRVLYASPEDECRALAVDSAGNIFAAVNGTRGGGAMPGRLAELEIKLPALALQSGSTPAPPGAAGEKSLAAMLGAAMPSAQPSLLSSGNSYVVKIQPDGFFSTFWQAPEGPIQAMTADPERDGSIFAAAGNKGKIYRLQGDTNYSLAADVDEPMVLSFVRNKKHLYFTTANKAGLYELVMHTREGLFESRALNAGTSVRWGHLFYEAEEPEGTSISFETRTGNTPDPDSKTWSGWAKSVPIDARTRTVASPVGQYLQYRLTLSADSAGKSPLIDDVQFFNIQDNSAPILRDIRVEKVGGEAAAPSTESSQARSSGMTVKTPSTSGSSRDSGPDPLASLLGKLSTIGKPATIPSRDEKEAKTAATTVGVGENSQKYEIKWDVTDPNGDKMRHNVCYKAEDETEWKRIEKDLTSPQYTLATQTLPDGKYRVRIETTDAPDNPETSAVKVSLVSRLFVVDNTEPMIKTLTAKRAGNNAFDIRAEAGDALSIIASAQYNIDGAKEWIVVFPEDGIFDFTSESFAFRAKPEKKLPEHTLTLRVFDREGNSRVAKVLLK